MNESVKASLRIGLIFALIWAIAWFGNYTLSLSGPGFRERIGKGRGGGGCRRRPRSFRDVSNGMIDGEFINNAAPSSPPAGQPFSTF